MRHIRSELEQRGAVTQRALGLAALRDVRGDPEVADDVPGGVAPRRQGQVHGEAGAVLANVGPLALVREAPADLRDEDVEARLDRNAELGAELRRARAHLCEVVEDRRRRLGDELGSRIPQHPLGRRVELADGPVRRCLDDGEARARQDAPQSRRAGERVAQLDPGVGVSLAEQQRSTPQLELIDDLLCEHAEQLALPGIERSHLLIERAERPEDEAVRSSERKPCVEAHARAAGDQRIVGEALVEE